MIDLPPLTQLWLPHKPAITRANNIPDMKLGSFMPGFRCVPGRTLSYVNSSNANTAAIALPSGSAAGDVAVLFDCPANSPTAPALVTPAGWTPISNVSFTVTRGAVSCKVLDSSDISAGSVTGMSGSGSSRKIMVTFRPNGTIANVAFGSLNEEAKAGTPVAQTITPPVTKNSVILLGHARGSAAVAQSGSLSSSGASITSSSTAHVAYYEIQTATKTAQTWAMGDTGDYNVLQSFYLTVV